MLSPLRGTRTHWLQVPCTFPAFCAAALSFPGDPFECFHGSGSPGRQRGCSEGILSHVVLLASVSAVPLSSSSWACPVGACLNWGGYSVPASLWKESPGFGLHITCGSGFEASWNICPQCRGERGSMGIKNSKKPVHRQMFLFD